MTWLTDENGNRCSVERWGTEENARRVLSTLKNCSHCVDCTGCSHCSHCTEQPLANMVTRQYVVCLRTDGTLKIGCEDHTVVEWLSFNDERIADMDGDIALKWWGTWKPVIESMVEALVTKEEGRCLNTTPERMNKQSLKRVDSLAVEVLRFHRLNTEQQKVIDIAYELAGHINRPIVLGGNLDPMVLRHWCHKFFEAKRELEAKAEGRDGED